MEGDTTYMVMTGLFTLAMLVMIWPRAMRMMKESPKGSNSDWKAALVPLLLVAGFVVLLILAV